MQTTDDIKTGFKTEPVLMSFEEMKQNFPDEWVLVADPEKDPNSLQILSGIVLLHSKDKKTASFEGRDIVKEKKYNKYMLEYTGSFRHAERYMTGFFRTTHGKI